MDNQKRRIPIFDKLLILITSLSALAASAQLVMLDKLPMKYLVPVIAVILLISLGLILVLKAKNMNTLNRYLSRILLIVLSGVLIVGNVYLYQTNSFLNNLVKKYNEERISVYVRKDDSAKKLEDVKDKTFYITDAKTQLMQDAVSDYNKKLNTTITTSEKASVVELGRSLMNKEVDVVILNEAMVSFITDQEDLKAFREDTKVLYTFKQRTKTEDTSNIKVDKEAFTMLISGIDTYGPISTSARSDVNILLTVNPVTRTVLMTNIPRDYYVNLPCNGINQMDKLTHAGIYGPSCSQETIGQLFGMKVDYVTRVNFDSLIGIVDSIGGVVVTPTSTFNIEGYQFYAGQQTSMNGKQALAFSRDRDHQVGGDRGRGANQMLVITAIINKLVSPSIITNYLGVLGAVSGSVETTFSQSDISKLAKMQLSDGKGWSILPSALDGVGGSDYTYSGGVAYVMYQDERTIALAKSAIDMVKSGKSAQEIRATFGQ